jgi:carbonic anhydrase/acetyltransferase-like protein (isoleucine patch superfamily)
LTYSRIRVEFGGGLITATLFKKPQLILIKDKIMMKKAIFLSVVILPCVFFLLIPTSITAQKKSDLNIDPTADVHPTAYLEGRVTVGPYTKIDAGTIITGNVTIGHHTLIRCNVTIRGTNKIGNYTHIYDNVNIEGGRPAKVGSSKAEVPDRSIIGDGCWINHGATMHGTQIGDGGAVGLNACCDYNTRIGHGAILANGSATRVGQVIPENSFAEGVPAIVMKINITELDRENYFGLRPSVWTRYEAANIEKSIRNKKGL